MPSVMSKLIAEKMVTRASKRHRLDGSKVALTAPRKKAVYLPSETMLDVALFLDRLDLDPVLFSCQRHRTFVEDNAHLIPLRELARISFEQNSPEGRVKVWVQSMEQSTRPAAGIVTAIHFNGTWDEMLAEKEQFQNVVRHSVPRRLQLATLDMEWHNVSKLFGDTPLTIRVSSELVIGSEVEPDILGIQGFLRPFALVNFLKIPRNTVPVYCWSERNCVAEKCDEGFLRWCTENSITQLELDEYGEVLNDDAILDYCFGSHGVDSEPRHLRARFRCGVDFMTRLLEANQKCHRKGPITMDLRAKNVGAPSVAELAPYRVNGSRRNGLYDVTTFLLPDDFNMKIVYSYHEPRGRWHPWNCQIEVYRPPQTTE